MEEQWATVRPCSRRPCALTMSFQWIGIALVKLPDGAAIKSALIDLEIGTEKQLRWEFFHRKSYSLGSRVESLVPNLC